MLVTRLENILVLCRVLCVGSYGFALSTHFGSSRSMLMSRVRLNKLLMTEF